MASSAAASRARTALVVRRPSITTSPKFQKLEARLRSVQKHAQSVAAEAESPMLIFAGAAIPAVVTRFRDGQPIPSIGGIDPELLIGGALMGLSFALKGKNRARLLALGTGCAAPAVNRAIKAGTIKVGEDDDDDAPPAI